MARKDDILKSFLSHPLIEEKYKLKKSSIPLTVRDALSSEWPIIKAIALIIEGSESASPLSDAALNVQIRQFLQEHAI